MQIRETTQSVVPIPASVSPQDRLEQAFLEEMLKYCGPQTGDGDFAGGHGEEHFGTFLTREYAAILAGKMDLGLTLDTEEGRT